MRNKLKLLLIIIGLIAVAGLIFFGVKKIFFKSGQTTAPTNQAATAEIELQKTKQEINNLIQTTLKTDRDLDGISDADEIKHKTNPDLADTDGDGLLDGDEINKFKTDPNDSDTDGDGYLDGEEVRNGYNPKG
ncbi:MAG: hypothetical protein COU31_03815 [Candidatus Magasanikbacteria bacterium CG10_big_fil_rev_8_21_14_0_10_40_10]|uniref:EF-hand domain-containing protein n=1 Tax=Candidatus Magasanikbacteria bacterium CG10_big_fil_rev_8_21_14_0_10_40_10 TaxID=1974648 RepID=A0A2M6W380_9BACT|nr:MAG: hypothetical protein COU31_03815 [Candidatus Magasanikbacteria bacterium CG10_big_fil_rev_8_21_14_0_10_40_10]